jgi:hypothetical protein
MSGILSWLEQSSMHAWILDTVWVWPTAEILHFVGLSLLIGSLLVVDLRLFGWLPEMRLETTHRLLPWVFVGFAINLVTGSVFFVGDPIKYAGNWAFQVKMGLVVVAGVNALWFYLKFAAITRHVDQYGSTPAIAKAMGGISLLGWTGVLIMGRLLPYLGME